MPYGFRAQGIETKGWPIYSSLLVTPALSKWPRFIVYFRYSFWFSLPTCFSFECASSFVLFRIYAYSLWDLESTFYMWLCYWIPTYRCTNDLTLYYWLAAVRKDVRLVNAESSIGAIIEAHSEILLGSNIQHSCSLFTKTLACLYSSSWSYIKVWKVCKKEWEPA